MNEATVCTCGTEQKFYYKNSWKFNDQVKFLANVRSSNTTHYKITYIASYEGACLSSYQNQDYFRIDNPTEKVTTIVNGKQNVIVTSLSHSKDVSIPINYYIYHCTLNLEMVAEPFY